MATSASAKAVSAYQARGMAQWEALYQTHNAIFKATELALLPHNLSLPQLHLLGILNRADGILTTGEIGRAMVKASQTITGLVDRLEVQDLVERKFDRRDRRKVWVRLTKKGEAKLAEAMPVANNLTEQIFSAFSDKQLGELEAKIDKLRTVAMQKLSESLGRTGF